MSEPPACATRRTAIAGTVAGLLVLGGGLTGCDLVDLDPSPEPAPGDPTGTGPQDPDITLVDDALVSVAEALALVRAAIRTAPSTRPALRPLLRLHRAQADSLGGFGDTSATSATSDPPAPGPRGLAAVRTREAALQTTLADAALQAESGALARLLAQLSAGIAQHLAILPEAAP